MDTLAQVALTQTAALGFSGATSSPRAIPGRSSAHSGRTSNSSMEEEVDVVSMDTSATASAAAAAAAAEAAATLVATSSPALPKRQASSSAPNSPALLPAGVPGSALPNTLPAAQALILQLQEENARLRSALAASSGPKTKPKRRPSKTKKGRASLELTPNSVNNHAASSAGGPPKLTVSGPSSAPTNLDAMTAAIAMTSVGPSGHEGPPSSPSPHPSQTRGSPTLNASGGHNGAGAGGGAGGAGGGFKLSSSWSPGTSFLTGSSPPSSGNRGLLAQVFHHRRSNSAVSAGSASATLAGLPSSLSSNGSSDRSPPGARDSGMDGGSGGGDAESPHVSATMMKLSLNGVGESPSVGSGEDHSSPRTTGSNSPTLSAKGSPRIQGGVTRRRNKPRPSLSTASSNTSMVYSPNSASVPSTLVPTPFEYGSGCVCFSMGSFHSPTHPYPTGMSLVKRVPKRGNQPNEYFMTTSTGLDGELRFTVTAGEHSETATKLGAALGPVLNAQGRVRLSGPHFFCLHDATLNRRLKVLADWQAQNQSVIPL